MSRLGKSHARVGIAQGFCNQCGVFSVQIPESEVEQRKQKSLRKWVGFGKVLQIVDRMKEYVESVEEIKRH